MIKTKNKQIYKQTTNKQTNKHFLDFKYLSPINSDLQEIIKVTSFGCPTITNTKKQIYKQTNKKKQTNNHL